MNIQEQIDKLEEVKTELIKSQLYEATHFVREAIMSLTQTKKEAFWNEKSKVTVAKPK